MKLRKLTALTLALCMTAALLAGCSQKTSDTPQEQTPDQTPAVDTTPPEPTANALKENLTGPIVDEPITLTGFVYEHSQFNANHDDMAFWKNLSAETNINFEFERIPGQGWTEKLNLKLASGTLPDFIGGFYNSVTSDDIAKYANKAFLNFEDLLADNAPNLVALMEKDPQLVKVMRGLDGGMYGFPSVWTEVEQNVGGFPMINQAWLDKLGLKMPETTEDLYNTLVAFKTKDPNGNGKADEVPMSAMDKTLDSIIAKIVGGAFGFPYYGANFISIDQNGKAYFSPACDGYKEAIKYLERLYSEGLLDQEIFSIDRPTFVAKANQGRDNQTVGVGLGGIMEQNFYGLDSIDDYVPLIPVKGPNGDQGYTNQNESYLLNTFVITTANKYPAETVRLVDRLYAPEWSLQVFEGPIGTAIQLSSDGKRYEYMQPTGDLSIDQMRYQSAPVSMPYYLSDERMTELFVPDPLMMENCWDNCRQFTQYLIPEVNPAVWPMSTDDAKEVAQMKVELKNFVQTKRSEWIAGKTDIDAEWDSYLSTLESMGVDKYVAYHQAAYDVYNQ